MTKPKAEPLPPPPVVEFKGFESVTFRAWRNVRPADSHGIGVVLTVNGAEKAYALEVPAGDCHSAIHALRALADHVELVAFPNMRRRPLKALLSFRVRGAK